MDLENANKEIQSLNDLLTSTMEKKASLEGELDELQETLGKDDKNQKALNVRHEDTLAAQKTKIGLIQVELKVYPQFFFVFSVLFHFVTPLKFFIIIIVIIISKRNR